MRQAERGQPRRDRGPLPVCYNALPAMKRLLWLILLSFALLLAGCAPREQTAGALPTRTAAALTPYVTATPTGIVSPLEQVTPTPAPTPTSTPRTHVVKKGEDLGGIAFQYGVTLAALMEANPEIDPYLLSVGATLIIPAPAERVDTQNLPSPTPVAVNPGPVHCYPSRDGGAWCFLLVNNPQQTAVENVSVQIQIYGGEAQISQTAATPLNLIAAGGELPVAAYFAAPLPQPFQATASLLTALPRTVDDQRYLRVEVRELRAAVQPDGFSALASGQVVLLDGEAEASQVWVALAAFDKNGRIVGTRRWEGSGSLRPSLAFEEWVYSAGDPIDHVLAWAEARP
ncbi:MAG: LysM peptidoglycan-binding domain-containing protein [Anaerolineae bacterium]|nr:LysM peptidoglycan-binding domain-containing protein [Anaerolineae bacterium]